MRSFLLALIIIFSAAQVSAQNLERKGLLHIYPAEADGKGAKIVQVQPNGAGDKMGLQAGDVIISVNGAEITTVQSLLNELKKYGVNDQLKMVVLRDGAKKTLKGKSEPKPSCAPEGAETIYDEVAFMGGWLRSIVMKPKGTGPFPAFFYIQGYPCSSMDMGDPDITITKLLNAMVERGYVVYRVEKPGMGESKGGPDCMSIDFGTEVNAFKAGYISLEKYSFVDKKKIFIFGHSLGGIVAPFVAAEFKPAGTMVYGTVLKPWHDYLVDLLRWQNELFGADPVANEEMIERAKPILHAYFVEKKNPFEMAAIPNGKEVLKEVFDWKGDSIMLHRHYRFWQDMNDTNLAAAWKGVSTPVFAVYGETDIAALYPDDHQRIADVVNFYHPGNGKFYMLPGTDHVLAVTESMKNGAKIRQSGEYSKFIRQSFNSEFPGILDNWMKEQVN